MSAGLLVKAISGFYYVEDHETVRQCRARGVFKKKGINPLVGDLVEYSPIGLTEGVIESIYPRTMELIRPPIANMDHALLVFSIREPDFSYHLLDRLLFEVTRLDLDCTIALTKTDLACDQDLEALMKPYSEMGYSMIFTSAITGVGEDEVKQRLIERKTFVAGQSGVGKSSLLNRIMPELQLKSGEISQKLGRGRHTTRHVELLRLSENTYVADTPGFSQLDFHSVKPEEVEDGFQEIKGMSKHCRYRGCLHQLEEDCAVISAVGHEIATSRYQNYLLFLTEVQAQFGRRY